MRRALEQSVNLEGRERAEALHTLGIWKLLWKSEEDDGEGPIDLLLAASRSAPQSAEILSDLTAAYLTAAASGGPSSHYLQAVASALSATTLDPNSDAAHFNLALALEKLPARSLAVGAWDDFLKTGALGGWAVEARQRRDLMLAEDEPANRLSLEGFLDMVAKEPSVVPDWIAANAVGSHGFVEGLLPRWAVSTQRDESKAAEELAAIEGLALEYENKTGDTIPLEASRWAGGLSSKEDFFGVIAVGQGVDALRRGQLSKAEQFLEQARIVLTASNSPLLPWVDYHNLLCKYSKSDYEGALDAIAVMRARRLDEEKDKRVLALVARIEGLIHQFQGSPEAAIRAFMLASEGFSSISDHAKAISTTAAIAWSYSELGEHDRAWLHMRRALEHLNRFGGSPLLRDSVFANAADLAVTTRLHEVAIVFQREAVEAAVESGQAIQIVPALRRLALLQARTGQSAEAQRNLAAANELFPKIKSAAWRSSSEPDLRLASGEILAEIAPAEALRDLEIAESLLVETDFDLRLPSVHLARSRAYLKLGRSKEAVRSIERAIEEIEGQRSQIRDNSDRTSFLDQRRTIYDEAVHLHYSLGDHERAFLLADASRARVLAERISGVAKETFEAGPIGEFTLKDYLAALNPGTRLLQFSVLKEVVLAWVISADSFTPFSIDIDKSDLEGLVDKFVQDLRAESGLSRADAASTSLSELFGPAMSEASREGTTIVVPDGPLHRLPFSALRKQPCGSYWLEKVRLLVAPSASLLLRSNRAAEEKNLAPRRSFGSVLVVASPVGAVDGYPMLAAADREAREVANIHGGLLLLADEATPARVLAEAPLHELVHIASHAVAKGRDGRFSRILLSGKNGAGWLLASKIAKTNLSRTRLVVLSACSTAGGTSSPTEGVASLSRAFLAAGAGAVVATLWDIDDEAAAVFSIALHQKLATGIDPLTAVRETQLELSKSRFSGRPRLWGAFQVYGTQTQ